jgi:hypothetical protein
MSVNLSPVAGAAAQFLDNSGNVLTGGKLYTYLAGTTTLAATYTSSTGTAFHSNPIILDAAGRVPAGGEIWLADNIQYKFVLKDSNDVLIGTWDNLIGINSNFVNYTSLEEIQVATAGQTVFNLSTVTYVPGTNSLQVYVDGVNQYDGITYAYVETNATTVTFTAGLHVGALVKFTTAVSVSPGSVNANLVIYDPAGAGAVTTTVQTKLREYASTKDYGALPSNTPTNNVLDIQAALDANVSVYGSAGSYTTNAIVIPNSDNVISSNNSSIYQETTYTPVFDTNFVDPAKDNVIISGFKLSQNNTTPIAPGLLDDHSMIRFKGGSYNRSLFNHFTGQYGNQFCFGAATLTDRRNKFGIALGNTFDDMQGMVFENIGASYAAIVANTGDAKGGLLHGIRLTGFSTAAGDATEAQCKGVVASANSFVGIANGISPQNAAKYWNISSQYIEDADVGVHLYTGTATTSLPQMGYTNFTASNVGRAIYGQGYGYCNFDFIADGSNSVGDFVEEYATVGAIGFNKYNGIVKGSNSRGAIFRYNHDVINLTVDGTTGEGVVIVGDYCTGTIIVNDAGTTGINITGNNNNIRCIVTGSTGSALLVSGSGNSVNITTDGNISVAGTNNQISGQVAGTIAKSGTGHSYSGILGYMNGGQQAVTTNGSGEMIISVPSHATVSALGLTTQVLNFTSNYIARIKTYTVGPSGTATLVIFDAAGSPVTGTSITASWNFVAR